MGPVNCIQPEGTMLYNAITMATVAHGDQRRKGTDIPYIVHPFSVAMILSQVGYSEEVVVAGVLHDTVEDTDLTLDEIREHFGTRVADIVEGCSEPDRSLPWETRKQHSLEYLTTASREVRAVSCADKLHNIRSIVADYREVGEQVWDRFNRGREQQEWYYRGLAESLCNQLDEEPEGSIFHRFRDAVEELFSSNEAISRQV